MEEIGLFGVWLNPNMKSKMPSQANEGDAGWDVCCVEDIVIPKCSRIVAETGVHLSMTIGWECQVRPRSGHAAKQGLTVLNTPGTVDWGYTDSIKVILFNTSRKDIYLPSGSKIAQLVFKRVPFIKLVPLKEKPTNENRGDKGFGSSGI
jgi:dUTP pyrophosphatase